MSQSTEFSVLAAIPNYNNSDSLKSLLPQVIKQSYDGIYVLDDASTDDSVAIAETFKDVDIVRGEINVGSGANRNRIIPLVGDSAIIHFIDSDVTLISDNNPALAREVFKDKKAGLVGGLISMPDGTPWMFNYGGRYSYVSQLGGWLQVQTNLLATKHSSLAKGIRSSVKWLLDDYPDITKTPESKNVFWVGEANMLIPSKIFAEVGGFDPALRYHEAHDLAHKLHARGFEVKFDPRIKVEHPQFTLDNMRNEDHAAQAERIIKHNYGHHIK